MSYENEKIADIIDDIDSRKIMLPSIQRKYVWEDSKITKLMDSIMRGYPFGTFLFWKIKKSIVNERKYPMYEFIKDYHERDMFNNPHVGQPFSLTSSSIDDTLFAVLDGQQRLTSLYIALKGSIARKIPKKHWDNPDAFLTKELYFNLLSYEADEKDEDNIIYKFSFLTEEEANNPEEADTIWYRVKDILQYPDEGELSTAIPDEWRTNKVIFSNIMKLYQRLKVDELINYFEVASDSMDDVLGIFVRVNSGGTVLSKTDLLFSTIVANWQNARDEIDNFLSSINQIGDHFEFTSDFIMRVSLYVLDMATVMKVDSFGRDNVELIKANWTNIKSAVKDTVNLLKEFGFSSENIVSINAILPMVYYRFKKGDKAFAGTKVKDDFKKYFVLSQIKKVFSGHTNQTLDILRNKLKSLNTFDLDEIINLPLSYGNTLGVEKDDIENWMFEFRKGPYTFLLLSLLYPDLKYAQEKFEQDHLHPDSCFTKNKLKKIVLKSGRTLSEDEINDWMSKKDTLPNLQFLTSSENESRQATPLKEWVKEHPMPRFMPDGVELDFENFIEFYDERKKILVDQLWKKFYGASR